MSARLKAQLDVSFEQLRRLEEEYGELMHTALDREPTRYEVAALATVLHSFYGGIENAMKRVADELDHDVPRGAEWHARLLSQMATSTDRRPPVIDAALAARLDEFLRFRHFFRHAYSYDLQWDKMAPLVRMLPPTRAAFEAQVSTWTRRFDP